jgi:hypothetical protein
MATIEERGETCRGMADEEVENSEWQQSIITGRLAEVEDIE